MPSNTLHHNRTLSNLNTNAKYAKHSRKWSRSKRNGETYQCSAWQEARRRYHRACRKASKLQLDRYRDAGLTQKELADEYYEREDDRYMEDMDWSLSRDEKRFNDEVRGRMHLGEDNQWRAWNKEYDKRR